MAGSVLEQQVEGLLRAHASGSPVGPPGAGSRGAGSLMTVMAQVSPGVFRSWVVPVPVLLEIGGGAPSSTRAGASSAPAGSPRDGGPSSAPAAEAGEGGAVGAQLRRCLAAMGLAPEVVELFAVAAATAAAVASGADLAQVAPDGDRPSGHARDHEADGARDAWGEAGSTSGETGVGGPDLAARAARASRVLGLVGSLTRLTAHLDGALVGVVSDLAVRNGRVLLFRRGLTDPGGLSEDQARRWRARTKSVTRSEIEAMTGWGQGEVADLVALATAPAAVHAPVVASMQAGVTPWRLARRFLRELGQQAHEDTAEVADRLFGTDPQTVCTDRLDPDGRLKDGPWEHRLFHRALAGEATRLASRDPDAAAEARRRARDQRDVRVLVHEDGTGSVSISGTATQVAAVADRLERGARQARALGDPRTLAHLRADLGMSLLMHSRLALPDPLPDDAGQEVRTTWTDQMRTVLAALPPAVLNVIVPFDALVHSPQRPLFGPEAAAPTPTGAPSPGGPPGGPSPGGPSGVAGGEVLSMGLVTGALPQFLTPDAVRELALTPGTSLHRLLMDPADGRCVERSVRAYAPDAAMRAQVHAADVTCRAPGCVQHAPYTQLDHVLAHGTGGPTSETNLQELHARHHDAKTHGGWQAVMATNRDVTWTSLLGRIYRTRAHDYRQYSTLFRAAVDRVHADAQRALADDADAHAQARAAGRPATGIDGRGEPRPTTRLSRLEALADAVDAAIYRALSHRGPARPLRSGDDHPGTDTDPAFLGWDTITLTHTTKTGQLRYGPDPATAEQERHTTHSTARSHQPGPHRTSPPPGDYRSPRTGWRHDPDDEPPPF